MCASIVLKAMTYIKDTLKHAGYEGESTNDPEILGKYSHDASMFEIRPLVITYPKDTQEVADLVKTAVKLKKTSPKISLTARSAGTDMSGAAINDSIIVDFSKHFTKIHEITRDTAHVQPGVYYRDFEPKTMKHNSLLPSYPASRDLCTVGGMVNNNSGGEKSLQYGKTEDYVTELEVVLSDGNIYKMKPLKKSELDKKMAQNDFEGRLYKQIFKLVDDNYDVIKAAKPNVSKDSTGYHLWNVWDRQTGIFDMTKLIAGAQGTLGFVTDIKFRLIQNEPESAMLICFMTKLDKLGEIINDVLDFNPSTFESFDDNTLWLAIKFLPFFKQYLGIWGTIKLMFSLAPDALLMLKGIPRLILMIEFTGHNEEELLEKARRLQASLAKYKMATQVNDKKGEQRYWIMRRQSFNLLRQKVKEKHTAPFIDDFVVPPEHLPEFLPQLRKIIKKYKLMATIAGHVGDGNFHVIPLMKFEDWTERVKIEPAMREVNTLVLKYKGSLSGEHNDGLVRGPWLEQMYGKQVVGLFRQTKEIFDPTNLFNPHKKTTANWDFSLRHLREKF